MYYNSSQIDRTPKIVSAIIDKMNEITLETNFPFSLSDGKFAGITFEGVQIKEIQAHNQSETTTNKIKIITEENLDLKKTYKVSKQHFGTSTVEMGTVIRSEEFDRLFYYDGNDLGSVYAKNMTAFRLWAPTASEAKLVIYNKWDDQTGKEITMKQAEKGTWKFEMQGNQDGLVYTYKVRIGDKWSEAVDPYARAVTVNGEKGVVVDLTSTNPKNWSTKKPALKKAEDAIFYELHIRDLSIQEESGIKQKGKYLGVAELGTKGPKGVKTGLSHIKDLGVTHVQFIPMYDYETVDETKLDVPQYNWGYDPKNYNAPEGSYSTNPYNPKMRITEVKQMIQALHKQNLRVVMDVVYNHVYSVSESNFHRLVPGYYFRYNEDGTLANGSGVGNDTASERKMMRKFIVDSVTYWAKEYHLDGFRFDLMGIHDVETMNEVRLALDKIDPSIIVIGEGWDLNTPLAAEKKANQKNAAAMPRIAHFNDQIRDGLKGSVFEERDVGFVNGKSGLEETIKKGIVAKSMDSYLDPGQVVTYVESHDNHTLWDKLALTNPDATEEERKQMHKLASSIILTSQGIPFIHAGQEFMRTKGGDYNSYKSPDIINQLDWERRAEYHQEVEYMKGLIHLRGKYPAFRLGTAEEIHQHLTFLEAPKNVIAYTLTSPEKKSKTVLTVVHNANMQAINLRLPNNGKFSLLVNGQKAGTKTIAKIQSNEITVPALTTFVLETK
ncbi:pullulanase [Peribacillus huizhouensis]|uniref:Pullulanase n=1 Tax=Peribacillus huizhouensis TaxID=1501239 RepID=A0ABR6CSS7_9BACI|nr:pullulanase [Peribacillus huizhouensis]